MRLKILILIVAIVLLLLGTSHAITANTTADLPTAPLQPNSRTVPVYNLQGGGSNTVQTLQPTQTTYRLQ